MCVYYVLVTTLLFIANTEGGFLKDLLTGQRPEVTESTMQLSTAAYFRQPLHRNEQNYLHDDVEDTYKAKAVRDSNSENKVSRITESMKDIGNGVYEFELGKSKCKFYMDRRQAERSLMCNAKQCSAVQNSWKCDGGLSCSITESTKKATCEQTKLREIINAPSRVARCPAGQGADSTGKCRPSF